MQYPSTKDSKLGTQTATLSVWCGHAPWTEAVMIDLYYQTFALSYWGTYMLFTCLNLLRWVKMGSERIIRDTEVYKETAIIRRSGIQFTEIKWLPCESFLALLVSFSPFLLFCVILIVERYICLTHRRAKLGIEGCMLL